MLGLVKLVSAIWATLMAWGTRGAQWLRVPGNPLKLGALLVAGWALTASFAAYRQNGQVDIVTTKLATLKVEHDADVAAWRVKEAEYRKSLTEQKDTFTAAVEKETKDLEVALDSSKKAVAAAEAKAQEAEKSMSKWQKVYNNQGATCVAARKSLVVACPELKSY